MSSERQGGRYACLDASAIVRLVVVKDGTDALERDVADRPGLLTSWNSIPRLDTSSAVFARALR